MKNKIVLSAENLKTVLQHLRTVHMTFVLAAIAIFSALSNSNTTYETAILQLQDVVTLNDTLKMEQLVATIPVVKPSRDQQAENGLKKFVDASLAEYFELLDIVPEDQNLSHLDVSLPEDIMGLRDPFNEEFQHSGNELWFETNKTLITNGKSEIYVNPTRLFDGNTSSVEQQRDRLNRFLTADTMLVSPNFNAAFFTSGSILEKRYPWPSLEVRTKLSTMKKIRLSARLTQIVLTDSESLNVYNTAQLHIAVDPAGYENYDFRFDELHLDITATSEVNERQKFTLILPVMFERRVSIFVSDALQSTQLANQYKSKYLSNDRTFTEVFPELSDVSKNLTSLSPQALRKYLEEQKEKSGSPISVVGLEINRGLIEVWGVILMLAIHLYFCMHYRAFLDSAYKREDFTFPWIGVYPHKIASFIFQLSLALPLGTTLFANLWLRQPDDNHVLEGFVVLLSICLFVWAECMYLRFRSNMSKLESGLGDQT